MTIYVVMRYREDVIEPFGWFQDEESAKAFVNEQPHSAPFYSPYFYEAVEEKV